MTTQININGEIRDAASMKVPEDRTFRGAWRFNGPAVEVDMPTAREIHRNVLRAEREKQLNDLDVQWFRAAETDDADAKAAIVAKKQKLRDVTKDPRIEAAATPEDLKKLTLDVLAK